METRECHHLNHFFFGASVKSEPVIGQLGYGRLIPIIVCKTVLGKCHDHYIGFGLSRLLC